MRYFKNDLLVFQPFGCQKARSTGSYIIRIPPFFVKREKSIFLNFYLLLYHIDKKERRQADNSSTLVDANIPSIIRKFTVGARGDLLIPLNCVRGQGV